ncbi:MAG: DUF805 domain-containing protein [Prolixibacteraceae bacterium]
MHYLIEAYKQAFYFEGRSRREEFWTFAIAHGIVLFLLTFFYYFFSNDNSEIFYEIGNTVYGLFVVVPVIALVVRRLHDTGRSAWWGMVILVPIIGQLAFLIFMLEDSQIGYNEYGEYPKFCPNL